MPIKITAKAYTNLLMCGAQGVCGNASTAISHDIMSAVIYSAAFSRSQLFFII